MPFNLGPMEMLVVIVVLLLLFGAKRLPELGSGIGKGIREFRRTMREVNDVAAAESQQPVAPERPWAQVRAPAQPSESTPAAGPETPQQNG